MEETSLKITGANKSFFNRLSKTISRIWLPTKITLNGMVITARRNSMIKAFEQYMNAVEEQAIYEEKYEKTYETYLEVLDKYIMDTVYTKVKNDTATEFEKKALSKYYSVIALKESEYVEYKFRKQAFLIDLDNETVKNSGKEKLIEKYSKFYIYKMDWLYKGILKNYSIKLADTTSTYDSNKEWIYLKILDTVKEYVENIFSLKLKKDEQNGEHQYDDIRRDYENFENFEVGKLDQRDNIEKNMLLLGLSRKLFTHSLPLAVAEQCYMKLVKDARCLVQDTKIATKREKAYNMLMNLIEDYNIKLLSTKVYWDSPEERDSFKVFWNKYKEIGKLKDVDFIEYVKQKEVLFIKDDMKKIRADKFDYTRLIKYYKRKLVDYEVMREIRSFKSIGAYKKIAHKEAVGE